MDDVATIIKGGEQETQTRRGRYLCLCCRPVVNLEPRPVIADRVKPVRRRTGDVIPGDRRKITAQRDVASHLTGRRQAGTRGDAERNG